MKWISFVAQFKNYGQKRSTYTNTELTVCNNLVKEVRNGRGRGGGEEEGGGGAPCPRHT